MRNKSIDMQSKGEIAIYQTKDKKVRLEVKLEQETVWVTQKQIAQLFGTQRPAITKHLHNIFKSKESREDSVCSILEHIDETFRGHRKMQCAITAHCSY